MSEIIFEKTKIKYICDLASSDKTLTKSKAKTMEGIYPVYAATIGQVFARINTYNNTDPCLVVVNDGDAGNTYIVKDEKYTIGKHATGLIPHDKIDLLYLQKVATPVFQTIAKGYGLGNLPKMDVLEAEVSIPIKNGEYDIAEQRRLADLYFQLEKQKVLLLSKIKELNAVTIRLLHADISQWKEVKPIDLFWPQAGKMSYSKTWAQKNHGNIPLYSGTTTGVYDMVNVADYNGEYLSWSIDGLAGYIQYHNGPFSVTCHRGVLEPKQDVDFSCIDLKYIKYVLQPVFRKAKKGREGDLGKNEYTSLKPIAIKKLNETIQIPIKKDGSFDLEKQKELAAKYEQIEGIKSAISKKVMELVGITVQI